MDYEKSCGAICYKIEQDTLEILVICHVHGKHRSFPKGHVEHGESEHQTALREVREETGVEIEILPGYREVTRYRPVPHITKDVVYFVGRSLTDKLTAQPEEVREVQFVPIDKAFKMLTYPSDRRMLKKAIAVINSAEGTSF